MLAEAKKRNKDLILAPAVAKIHLHILDLWQLGITSMSLSLPGMCFNIPEMPGEGLEVPAPPQAGGQGGDSCSGDTSFFLGHLMPSNGSFLGVT